MTFSSSLVGISRELGESVRYLLLLRLLCYYGSTMVLLYYVHACEQPITASNSQREGFRRGHVCVAHIAACAPMNLDTCPEVGAQ
jgi:hypothetical protein